VTRTLHDAQRLGAPDGHPRDARGAKVVDRHRLSGWRSLVQLGASDISAQQPSAKATGHVAI
jgi:hypothetical protein